MTQSTLHVMVGLLVTVMLAVTAQAGCPAGDLDGDCRDPHAGVVSGA